MITLNDLTFLASGAGEALLAQLAAEDLSERNTLPLITRLREIYTVDQAREALIMARLRAKALDKFGPEAARMFFTEDSLQQASHPLVRNYRAQKMNSRSVLDVCCGIGTDSLALAQNGAQTTGLDIDPVRVALARLNAEVLGLDNLRFEVADVRQGIPSDHSAIFFDPARRDEQGRRIFDVERYIPPLALVRGWRTRRIVVKLSPGVNLTQLVEYGGSVEFISVGGELKEAVLWLDSATPRTMATLLTEGEIYHWQCELAPVKVTIAPPCRWLIEPNPALIRAGLVQEVAMSFGGFLLDETIAYFTADNVPDSPWLRAWQILDWIPFHLKRLRTYLRERGIGHVTVKKRGSPVTPEELRAKLKLQGGQSCTLVLTRYNGQPIVLICEDYRQ